MRIFIVDNQIVFREGLKAVLVAARDSELVGEASSVDSAFPLVHATRPELLVVDLALSGDALKDAIRRLKEAAPEAQIAILTTIPVAQDLVDAIAAGAIGYVLKTESVDSVMGALRRVARGQHYVTPSLEHIF